MSSTIPKTPIEADRDHEAAPHLFGNVLVISFQTQAEVLRGAIAANWGPRRRQHLESRLNKYVVEPSSYALSLRWAQAMDSARRNG